MDRLLGTLLLTFFCVMFGSCTGNGNGNGNGNDRDTASAQTPTRVVPARAVSEGKADEWLIAHNRHRSKKNLPQLQWSAELAVIAEEWAATLARTQCGSLQHRPGSFLQPRDLGENLATASASPNPPTRGVASAVDDWANEEQFYNYGANRCRSGKQCGHYTQVVWRDTREVGCGEAFCEDGGWQTKVWACNYRPAGNIVGNKPY